MRSTPTFASIPTIPAYDIGEPGAAARLEGLPAMLFAQQPDTAIDAGVVGALTIRGASVRGVGHRYDGTCRQDDFCLGTAGRDGEYLVAVVADGVSAGPKSHIAARVAVRLGVQLLTEALALGDPDTIIWDQLVGTIAGHVLLQARKESGDQTLDAGDAARLMATTAAFVIVPTDADVAGERACIVLPIGDTSVWILRADGSWEPITLVKNAGEAVASSAVFALPLLPADTLVPLGATLQPGDALFVVTDGIGDPLGSGDGDVGAALSRIWSAPPNRYEFAAQVDFGRRSHTDDRTVVGVWPDQPSDEEPLPSSMTSATPVPPVVDLAPPPAPAAPVAPTAEPAGAADPREPVEVVEVVEVEVVEVIEAGPAPAPPAAPADPDLGLPAWEPLPWEPPSWSLDPPPRDPPSTP